LVSSVSGLFCPLKFVSPFRCSPSVFLFPFSLSPHTSPLFAQIKTLICGIFILRFSCLSSFSLVRSFGWFFCLSCSCRTLEPPVPTMSLVWIFPSPCTSFLWGFTIPYFLSFIITPETPPVQLPLSSTPYPHSPNPLSASSAPFFFFFAGVNSPPPGGIMLFQLMFAVFSFCWLPHLFFFIIFFGGC